MIVDQKAHGGRKTLRSLAFLAQGEGGLTIERYADDGTAARLILRRAEPQPELESMGNHLLAARATGFDRPLESRHGH